MRATILLLIPIAAALCSAEQMSFTGPQCRFLEQMRVNVSGICRQKRGTNRASSSVREAIASSPRVTAAAQQRQAAGVGRSTASASASPSAPGRPSSPGAPSAPAAPSAPSLAASIRGQVNAATAGLDGLGGRISSQVNAATSGLGAQISGQVNSGLSNAGLGSRR